MKMTTNHGTKRNHATPREKAQLSHGRRKKRLSLHTTSRRLRRWFRRPSRNILSIADILSALKRGLQQCNDHHDSKCQVTPIANRSPDHIPDWVIDCCNYCLVRGNTVTQYVALSYVWMSPAIDSQAPTERIVLQQNNLCDFQQPGFLNPKSKVAEKLPKVIRDSVGFVRMSDVQYLWVDSLCIIQNDETTSENFGKMKEIYSGAYFTIIAATTSSELYGSGTGIGRVANIGADPNARRLHRALLASHWATRGWTFQEQLLSKRSFVFLDETEFWDCQCAVWWSGHLVNPQVDVTNINTPEGELVPQPRGNRIAIQVRSANRQLSQNLASISKPNFGLYTELICRYNYRDLTYAQDALPAISGVLDALTPSFSGGFISGLPVKFFDLALLWQPLVKAKRRIRSDKKPGVCPPLPSWSWAGWQCLIDPGNLKRSLTYEIRDEERYLPTAYWRRTRKLVDWTSSTTVDDDHKVLNYPGILEQCERSRDFPSDITTKDTDPAERLIRDTSERMSRDQCSYGSNPTSGFCRPFPAEGVSSVVGSQGYKSFLSCTTFTTRFKIRRILFPHKRVPILGSPLFAAPFDISVLDTPVYTDEPNIETYCPVITLEDNEGRWAGLLRVMDDDPNIEARQVIELAAISQGSSSYIDAAETYDETVDRLACYQFGYQFGDYNSDHCHFSVTRGFQQPQSGDGNEDFYVEELGVGRTELKGTRFRRNLPRMRPDCYKNMEEDFDRVD